MEANSANSPYVDVSISISLPNFIFGNINRTIFPCTAIANTAQHCGPLASRSQMIFRPHIHREQHSCSTNSTCGFPSQPCGNPNCRPGNPPFLFLVKLHYPN